MNQKNYLFVSAFIFILVSLAHLFRVITYTEVIVGTWVAPMSISWIGFIVTAMLAIWALRLAKKT